MHEVNGPAFLMPIADAKVAPGPYGQTDHSTEAGIPAQGRAIPREATAISEDYSEFLICMEGQTQRKAQCLCVSKETQR